RGQDGRRAGEGLGPGRGGRASGTYMGTVQRTEIDDPGGSAVVEEGYAVNVEVCGRCVVEGRRVAEWRLELDYLRDLVDLGCEFVDDVDEFLAVWCRPRCGWSAWRCAWSRRPAARPLRPGSVSR